MTKFVYLILFLGVVAIFLDFCLDYQAVVCESKFLIPHDYKILCL